MPITHLFKDNLLMCKARGNLSADNLYTTCRNIMADPDFQPPVDTLIDLREALVDMPGGEIERIVYRLNDSRFFDKMALVAPPRSFTYAMGRMFCIRAEFLGLEAEIFPGMREAAAWLYAENEAQTAPTRIEST